MAASAEIRTAEAAWPEHLAAQEALRLAPTTMETAAGATRLFQTHNVMTSPAPDWQVFTPKVAGNGHVLITSRGHKMPSLIMLGILA